MSERRMFAKTIIDSDAFLDMPLSTQALYFHLSMRADDEGFINNPKKIMRMIGSSDDDIKVLIAKRFIIPFESGIVVIKHWFIHNYIRGDRIKPTQYQDEAALLTTKDNGAYTLVDCQSLDSQLSVNCQSSDSVGKVRLGKDRLSNSNDRFTPPTPTDVERYATEKGLTIDADKFCDFYESKGWMVGKNKMKDWKAAVRGWCSRDKAQPTAQPQRNQKVQAAYGFSSERKNTNYNDAVWANIRKGWDEDGTDDI